MVWLVANQSERPSGMKLNLSEKHFVARRARRVNIATHCCGENRTKFTVHLNADNDELMQRQMTYSSFTHCQREKKNGNACYHSVQNLLSSHLLAKNLKIRIYKTKILPVVLYGCET
jgi:hypothetical protein